MQVDIIYQSSIFIPDGSLNTSFQQGPGKRCGIVLSWDTKESYVDHEMPVLFLEYENQTEQVVEYRTIFPYRLINNIHLIYDAYRTGWLLALNAGILFHPDEPTKFVIDFYEIHSNENQIWNFVKRIEEPTRGPGKDHIAPPTTFT